MVVETVPAASAAWNTTPSRTLANQHMAAVLKAKGYAYRYVYAEGARHTDANVIYQTLPQALEYIWQGFPIK